MESPNTLKGKHIRPIILKMNDSEFKYLWDGLCNRKFVPETTLLVIKYIREGKSSNKIHELMGWKNPKQFNWITNNIAKNHKPLLYQFDHAKLGR